MIRIEHRHQQTAGTSSAPKPKREPHNFLADSNDPGYRPVCRICGLSAFNHPYVKTPRRPK